MRSNERERTIQDGVIACSASAVAPGWRSVPFSAAGCDCGWEGTPVGVTTGVDVDESGGSSIMKRSSDGGHVRYMRAKKCAPPSRARFDTVSRSCWQYAWRFARNCSADHDS